MTAQITSNVDGISIELLGTVSKWDNAFGEPWLDIQTFTLKLGISIGAGGGVSLDLGLLGQLKLGVAPNTKDLTLAIKVSITPTPPWVVLQGFTLASYDGIGVKDVARLIGVDASGIPDLSLKNLLISFGVTADVDLCIRQGFYLTAELHINAPSSTGADPACSPGDVAGSSELPTTACLASSTCVAAILIDVNTTPGPDFGFTGAAAINAFDLGPIHIDATEILLKITTQEQRFRFSGGGYLEDPTGATDDRWAEGSLTIDFSNNGGLVSFYLHGFVEIAGGYLLSAEVTANVSADFSQIGTANGFLAFINSLEFDVTVTITSEAWDDFVDALEDAGEELVAFVDDTGQALEGAYDDVVGYFGSEYCGALIDPPYCTATNQIEASRGEPAAYIAQRIQDARNDILHKDDLGIDYTKPIDSFSVGGVTICDAPTIFDRCNQQYANYVRDLLQDYWDASGGNDYIGINGIHETGWNGGSGVTFNSIFLNFLGKCDVYEPGGGFPTQTGDLVGTVACDGTGYGPDMVRYVISPIIVANFPDETGGYTLNLGQNGVDAVNILDDTLAPGDPVATVQGSQSEAQTVPTFQPTCGSTTLGYEDNTVDPLTIEFSHPGPSDSATQVDLDNGNIDSEDTIQGVVDSLTTNGVEPECLSNVIAPNYGNTSVQHSGVATEGVPYTINGIAASGDPLTPLSGVNVVIDWGDGSPASNATTNGDGSWTASHTYADDPGPGPTAPYDIHVNADSAAEDKIVEVIVQNFAPAILGIAANPEQPDVGEAVDFEFFWADSGILDSFELLVDWGDGSPTTLVPVPASGTLDTRTVILSHTYAQALSIGQTSRDYTITWTVTDKDTGTHTSAAAITVYAVLPPVSAIIAKNADGSTYAPGSWTNQDVVITVIPSDTGRPPYTTSYGIDNPACGQSWPLGQFCTYYAGPFTVTGDGVHNVIIYSRDASATEYPVFFPVKIDKTPPQVVLTPPALPLGQGGYYNSNQAPVQIAVTASDVSGVSAVTCTVNGQGTALSSVSGMGTTSVSGVLAVSAQGTVEVVCVATNGANGTGAGPNSVNTKTIMIDSVKPTVAVTGVTQGGTYTLGQFTPGCTTTDPAPSSGVVTNASLSDSGANGMGAGTVTSTCSGAKDGAGNVSSPVSVTYSVVCAPDRHLPRCRERQAGHGGLQASRDRHPHCQPGDLCGDRSHAIVLDECRGFAPGKHSTQLEAADEPGAQPVELRHEDAKRNHRRRLRKQPVPRARRDLEHVHQAARQPRAPVHENHG